MNTPDHLREHLKAVENEIYRMAHLDNVFWQVQAVLKENPQACQEGVLNDWMGNCYADSAAMALRRLADKSKDSQSLWRLLLRISESPKLLTRNRFMELHQPWMRDHAKDWFDELAGGQGLENIPIDRITEIQDQLIKGSQHACQHATRRVAHMLKKPMESVKWHDVRVGIFQAFCCYRWALRVLESCDPVALVPEYQGDWLKDLRVPWLPADTAVPKYKTLEEVVSARGVEI